MTRIAVIEKEKCNPVKCGNLCVKLCPINRTHEDCIIMADDGKPYIEEPLCTGCNICSNRCPFGAISIINLPEALDKDPIQRHGENGFCLYNLPIPIFGKVVGILGRNGIGKTTAVKILAGILKPNLGKISQVADYDRLIKYFKGSEAHSYFEKVKKGEIKISYKPQQVDLIPKTSNGVVLDLLKKVDEKNKLKEYTKELGIDKILDRDIKNISGGELQRVAICACLLKEADVYFLDEPTSYLDIEQRINVSKFVKTLADENTAIMIVEHDLIILDYMTDLVHIMYGKPGAYGIVSQPKATKSAINVYLSGYLKEENMRFRDKEIKFLAKPPVLEKEEPTIISWNGIKKKLENFSLESGNGNVKKHDVVGILGKNGIGKTSFVKILAGELEKDEGEIDGDVTVSYKPQYLESDSEELVTSYLNEAISNYEPQLIRPLEIKPLLLKRLCDLSGGELQRVSIAHCLSKKASLYLLDEPSAYLDVEQRLILSRIIKNFMEEKGSSALIVDHDLLFLDYISLSLMTFSGEPAITGKVEGPFTMEEGMHNFLEDLNITLRRDPESNRPRVNKEDSQMDKKQKREGKWYYG